MRPIARAILRTLPAGRKQWLKSRLGAARRIWSGQFHGYDATDLLATWAGMGLTRGDTVLMHSAFLPTNGFHGKPLELIDTLLELIGSEGTLAMMSMPYSSSTRDYLASNPTFDVRRTPSQMGIVTEIFRRRRGVVRSLSATHPVLAVGSRAAALVDAHERCRYPCGPGSPLERMLEANAKMAFFDLPFVGFTFFHYIEHRLENRLPFPLYDPTPMRAAYVDYEGNSGKSEVFVFSKETIERRRVEVITDAMRANGTAKWRRLGNTDLVLASMADALAQALRLADAGKLPFSSAIASALPPTS